MDTKELIKDAEHWTPDRPTKPGKYWLSVHPDKRGDYPASMPVKINERGDVYAGLLVLPWLLEGALWRPYVEPPDPFAEPVPSLRERVEALERYGAWTPDSGGAVVLAEKEGAYLLRSEVLVLLDEVTR